MSKSEDLRRQLVNDLHKSLTAAPEEKAASFKEKVIARLEELIQNQTVMTSWFEPVLYTSYTCNSNSTVTVHLKCVETKPITTTRLSVDMTLLS